MADTVDTVAEVVDWLLKQLKAIEAAALAVEDNSAPWDGQWKADGPDCLRTYNDWVLFYKHKAALRPGLVAHVALHDPRSVLADVASKRAIIDVYVRTCEIRDAAKARIEPAAAAGVAPPADALRDWSDATSELAVLEGPICHLAAAYAHRPGYKEAWKP